VVIGVINTTFDTGLFWLLLRFFDYIKGKQNAKNLVTLPVPAIANTISYSSAVVLSFFLNSAFTFAGISRPNPSFLSFLLVSLFSLAVSTLIIQLFSKPKYRLWILGFVNKIFNNKGSVLNSVSNLLNKLFLSSDKKFILLVKLVTIGITLLTNYFGYRWLVF
jgi:putative flippase GtrA